MKFSGFSTNRLWKRAIWQWKSFSTWVHHLLISPNWSYRQQQTDNITVLSFSGTCVRSAQASPTWERESSSRSSTRKSSFKFSKYATFLRRKWMKIQRQHRNCSRFSSPMASTAFRPSRWSRLICPSTRNLEQKWVFMPIFLSPLKRKKKHSVRREKRVLAVLVEKSLTFQCFSRTSTFSHYAFSPRWISSRLCTLLILETFLISFSR